MFLNLLESLTPYQFKGKTTSEWRNDLDLYCPMEISYPEGNSTGVSGLGKKINLLKKNQVELPPYFYYDLIFIISSELVHQKVTRFKDSSSILCQEFLIINRTKAKTDLLQKRLHAYDQQLKN